MGSFTSENLAKQGRFPCPLVIAENQKDFDYDSIVIVAVNSKSLKLSKSFADTLAKQLEFDHSIDIGGCVAPIEKGKRLIFSPTGPISVYEDVRIFGTAAATGIMRALGTGSKKPFLVIESEKFPANDVVTVGVLGALEALYHPLQARETVKDKSEEGKLSQLGVWIDKSSINKAEFLNWIVALESGRWVSRDIGGGDPERMAPPLVAAYVQDLFKGSPVKVEVISDVNVFKKEYPLFEAVNRAASLIDRHAGQIIYLTYEGKGPIVQTLMPVGKGITYDTGGADVKTNSFMAGMSRDKCGAAAVVGLFQYLALEQPKGVKVIGGLPFCRNSIGENCYVADEVIKSRNGARVRVGNTDAEGRMAMTDVLCKIKEMALKEVNPHLMTIATLTGAAIMAFGTYTAIMDNAAARESGCALKMEAIGESMGEIFEVCKMRKDDFNFVKGRAEEEDILQDPPGPRGYLVPAAFMIGASGLDKHDLNSEKPLKYTHFDIAPSHGKFPFPPSSIPMLALAKLAKTAGETAAPAEKAPSQEKEKAPDGKDAKKGKK